jgi:uncharacterized protein YjbJ (UPF0337 family)
MNKEVLETQWVHAKEFLRERWGKLTDEDVRQINGRYELLVDKLQQRYGYTHDQAEEEIRRWNIERAGKPTFSTEKPYVRQEEKVVRKDETSSLLKWLLALAIPLLLLGLYFGSTSRAPEGTTVPGTVREDGTVIAGNPVDQRLVQTIRQTLLANSAEFPDLRNVRLSASNGVVTVSGSVASAQERDRVVNILQNVSGVRQINNQLEVSP